MKNLAKRSKSKVQHEENSPGTLAIIMNTPGLQHLAEEIFLNLNSKALENCQQINQSSSKLLENPLFWMKKLVRRGLSKKNEEEWMKVIKLVKNSEKEKHVVLYLEWKLKMTKGVVDLPCYTNTVVQDEFRNQIWKCCRSNPKTSFTCKKYAKIVKFLAPLTDNPNAPDNDGWTPIHQAANNGHTEIVKILAPLTDNPNAPNQYGQTPFQVAKNAEICRILELNPSINFIII